MSHEVDKPVSTSLSGSQKARDTLAYLRSQITNGNWNVGELIPKEPELMTLIGVGKSTVREAVRALATLGILQTVPGVGTFVRARTAVSTLLTDFLSDHDLKEVLVYRRSLEIEAAQTAAVNRTEAQLQVLRTSYEQSLRAGEHDTERCNDNLRDGSFHQLIVKASGSQLLYDLYSGVMEVLNAAAQRGLVFLGTSRELMLEDHGAVLQALEARDVRHAAHGMALHVDRDLGLHSDMLEFSPHTERATSLLEAAAEGADTQVQGKPTGGPHL